MILPGVLYKMETRKKKISIDPVLFVAWVLAIISAFFVHPDKEYPGYIDFRSLGILWGLMVIIQGFRENSVFEKIGSFLLVRVKKSWQLAAILVFMCFFGSMLITNDVALITFVPFGIMILNGCKRQDMMIPVIVLQTIAANLGSMLTPIGNPQNLYIYGLTGMGLGQFILTLLPFSVLALVLLLISLFIIPKRSEALENSKDSHITSNFGSKRQIIIYAVLFTIALLTVVRVIPWYVFALIVLIIVAGMDYKILLRADYILLLTFIGFFIFTGNIARIEAVSEFLRTVIDDREFLLSVVVSQFISNVPATLMLSGFTDNYTELLRGVNVGGLGTLIASMASLISYKAFSKDFKDQRGRYLLVFTVMNLVFLAFMLILWLLI